MKIFDRCFSVNVQTKPPDKQINKLFEKTTRKTFKLSNS